MSFRDSAHAEKQDAAARGKSKQQRLLLCRAGSSERIAVPLALVSRLEEFTHAQIEHAAGCQVVRYRGQILPLVDLAGLLGSGSSDPERDPVSVVVFDDGHIIASVWWSTRSSTSLKKKPTPPSSAAVPGLLGSAVVDEKATDFLDLRAVFEAAKQSWYDGEPAEEVSNGSILLIDQSGFSRGLIRSYLEMAGHNVVEAGGVEEALEKLESGHIDLTIVSANLPGNGAVLERIREQDQRSSYSGDGAGGRSRRHLARRGPQVRLLSLQVGAPGDPATRSPSSSVVRPITTIPQCWPETLPTIMRCPRTRT